jgi:hypothetical protein
MLFFLGKGKVSSSLLHIVMYTAIIVDRHSWGVSMISFCSLLIVMNSSFADVFHQRGRVWAAKLKSKCEEFIQCCKN